MPMRREAYPDNWDEISLATREKAGWKCEQCGLPNGLQIVRSGVDGARYIVLDETTQGFTRPDGTPIRDSEIPDEFDTSRQPTKVTLTVHHIGVAKPDGTAGDPHDKMDVRPENLTALCQRCHLAADMPIHIANAAKTRRRKKHAKLLDAGQLPLFED